MDEKDAVKPAPPENKLTEEVPVVTKHRLRSGGKTLDYSVTAGMLPLKNEKGEIEGNVFFTAYNLEPQGNPGDRALMFSFNGGPGSSSVWLHLGALGPKRVRMDKGGMMPAAPYQLVENPSTWLEYTDLVFVDPVGTGYSRAASEELGKKFWSLKGDIDSMGEFIRLYLTRYRRWASPLFLVGESYGTTRAAGLAGHLVEKGIAFNGILLVSSILQFQTADFTSGNDLPYALFLPTYCATAMFHGAIKSSKTALKAAEEWAMGEYSLALAKGDSLSKEERKNIAQKLSSFTGLSPEFLDRCNLRVEIRRFCKELLRQRSMTVGRLDSRFTGCDADAAGEHPEFDPSMTAIRPPFTAMLNDYVRRQLGYETDLEYYILGGGFKEWDWGSAEEGHPDTSDALRQAFAKNPHMRLFVASGHYDLATPYFATLYTLDHMRLPLAARERIQTEFYEAGHMMYIDEGMLEKLHKDVGGFIKAAR